MKYRGINYDVGNNYRVGMLSRVEFDPAVIKKEIEIIHSELHCNAIRISGYDISRLVTASEFALKNDLTVFFSPSSLNASRQDTADYILRGAEEAEKLRERYKNVVYVIGGELSLFSQGFIGGNTTAVRLRRMFNPLSLLLNILKIRRRYNKKLNDFFAEIMSGVRQRFRGEITYASGTWEDVNWSLFDIVGIDHYRASYNKSLYRDQLRGYFKYNKPVIVLEFGCCCYKGAEDKGGAGWTIVDWDKEKPELKGDFIRDESIQSEYIRDLLDIFTEENISGSFVFTFVQPSYVYDENPKFDLDMACYGIVKMVETKSDISYEGMPWVPKKAFYRVSEYYSH